MKAIQFKEFGPPKVLEWLDVEKPEVSEGDVLLKVAAAGINPIDAKIRDGSSFAAQQLTLPAGMGFDVCGEVVECGENVTAFQVGQMVLGNVGRHDNPSAYAQYCLAKPADLVLKPEKLSAEDAAALPIAGLTAWQAVHAVGHVKKGERVLIQAAAGGVGHLAVQFAKLAGAYVIGTASHKHHEFLQSLGIDEIIDYHKAAFDEVLTDIDIVIDLVGGETGLRSLAVLKSGGRIVTVPTITRDEILQRAKSLDIEATGMLAETNQNDLTSIANLIADGKVKINVAEALPMKDAARAHQLLEEKRTQGKLVLVN